MRQASAVRVGARPEVREGGVARDGHTLPDLPRAEHLDERGGAAHMVGVGVRHGEHVEATHAERPQRRRDHALPHVETSRATEPASVNEERAPGREPDDRRISLPHIEHDKAEPARDPARMAGCGHDEERTRRGQETDRRTRGAVPRDRPPHPGAHGHERDEADVVDRDEPQAAATARAT